MTDLPPKITNTVAHPETLADRLVSLRVIPLLLAIGFIVICCFAVVPLMAVFQPDDAGAIFVYTCFGVICAAAGLVAIACASTAGVSLISALPMVWSTLRARRLAWWLSGLAVYVTVAVCVTLAVVTVLEGGWISFWEVLGFATTIVSFAVMMTATLLSVRLLGFRLLTRNPLPE